MVLKQRTEEEIEVIDMVLGSQNCMAGIYSFGEIAPQSITGPPELHNQSMTIITISER